MTIQAAGYRGRPVFFEVARRGQSALARARRSGHVVVIERGVDGLRPGPSRRRDRLSLARTSDRDAPIAAVPSDWARRCSCVYAATWLLVPHVSRLDAEANRLFTFVGIGLFVGGVMCLVYLALEPFVRRSWPTMLVGWSRALAGRLRDPVVGRDLLIGTASGLALTALEHANVIVPRLVGWPEPAPLTSNLGALEHTRYFVLTITNSLNNGLQNALLSVMMFTLVREIIKRVLGRLAPSRWSTDAISAGIAITALTLIRLAESPVGPPRFLARWRL